MTTLFFRVRVLAWNKDVSRKIFIRTIPVIGFHLGILDDCLESEQRELILQLT